MRRKDREVTNLEDQLAVLDECKVCRIALRDEQGLYIVPLNFGYQYENGCLTLYFHSAKSGRKINALEKNSAVAFEMDCGHRLMEADEPCRYSYSFASVIGNGTASLVWDGEEKKRALSLLMKHQILFLTTEWRMRSRFLKFLFPRSAQKGMRKKKLLRNEEGKRSISTELVKTRRLSTDPAAFSIFAMDFQKRERHVSKGKKT